MEAAAASSGSATISKLKWPLCVPSFPSPSFSRQLPFISSTHSIPAHSFKALQSRPLLLPPASVKGRGWSALNRASAKEIPSASSSERWLLEPVGNGDSRHIGFKVPLPDAFVIASDAVTVGRLPDKADVVIPVATVSGIHARLEKKGGALLITDLDSTNGTYIGDKRLRPGAVTTVPPGSYVTFGDINLAVFRVTKIEEEVNQEEEKSEAEANPDTPTQSE